MDLGEIFGDALKYPLLDFTMLLLVGVVILLSNMDGVLAMFGLHNGTFSTLWPIVTLIIMIFLLGYGISVLRESITLSDVIPCFDLAANFMDGLKALIVSIVYFILPTIIVAILGFVSFGAALAPLASSEAGINFSFYISDIKASAPLALNGTLGNSANATTPTAMSSGMESIPPEVWSGIFGALAITAIVAILLFLIFSIFADIGLCRMAKFDSIGEAFNFGEIISDIKAIGILKIIGYLILAVIISLVVSIIIGLISAIPYVGYIISLLVCESFILLFFYRSLGLLYSDA